MMNKLRHGCARPVQGASLADSSHDFVHAVFPTRIKHFARLRGLGFSAVPRTVAGCYDAMTVVI
jgi:hypothetical protein